MIARSEADRSARILRPHRDLVAYQTTWRGTHSGPWRGIAPTGKRVQWRATAFRRVVDGKVVEGWGTYDWLAVLEQLGATFTAPGV